jgi:hypothetical protein
MRTAAVAALATGMPGPGSVALASNDTIPMMQRLAYGYAR